MPSKTNAVKPKPKPDVETTIDSEEPAPGLVEVVYKGITFVIPRDRDDWPTEGLAFLSEGKYNLFVKHMLEIAKPGQWQMLVLACPRRSDYREFYAVFTDALQECVG